MNRKYCAPAAHHHLIHAQEGSPTSFLHRASVVYCEFARKSQHCPTSEGRVSHNNLSFFTKLEGIEAYSRSKRVLNSLREEAITMNQTNSSDTEELISEARHGSHHALAQVINDYRAYLTLLARAQKHRYLQAKFDDSDLVQETCLQAHQSFQQFNGTSEAEFMQWLRKIMAHTAAKMIRHYSQQKRNVNVEHQLEQGLNQSSLNLGDLLASPGSSPSQRAMRRERAKVFADALSVLKTEYREVVILHYIEGLSMDEVAQRMGRSANAVQKLWARAIVQLRHALTDEVF